MYIFLKLLFYMMYFDLECIWYDNFSCFFGIKSRENNWNYLIKSMKEWIFLLLFIFCIFIYIIVIIIVCINLYVIKLKVSIDSY